MKRAKYIIIETLLIFLMSACSLTETIKNNILINNDDEILQEAITFKSYELYSQEGYPIISTYLPDNWTQNVIMNYRISSKYPLQAIASLSNPDDTFGIFYFSPMSFKDSTELLDGRRSADDGSHSILDYSSFYHYRDAYETSDLLLSTMGYKWIERDSFPIDQNILNEYNQKVQEKTKESFNIIKNTLDQGGLSYQSLQLNNCEATIDKSRGWISDGNASFYAETQTYVSMSDIRFEAATLMLINQLYGNETIDWQYDGFSIYWAVDEETFNNNYNLAQFIISNTGTTKSFDVAKDKVLSIMIPMVINGRQEIMDYGASIVNEVMQNWNDTNERVAQNWDDYILDQDRYVTNNGLEICVPTNANYVYYDDSTGDIVWSESALHDTGSQYQMINKKY